MPIRDISLFLRAEDPYADVIAFAARVAAREGAAVEGVCLFAEPDLPFADDYAIGQAAAVDVLDQRDRAIEALIAPIERTFHEVLAASGAPLSWRLAGPGEPAETTAVRARFADMVILRRPELHHLGQAALASALVFSSGTPCLIAPDGAAGGFERILLAWDSSANAKRALDGAMGFVETAKAVEVLLIDEGGMRAEDERSQALLSRLERHGVRAALRHDRNRGRSVGAMILDGCQECGADLLVMGAYGPGRRAEAVFGGATRTVLSHAPIPVLMAH